MNRSRPSEEPPGFPDGIKPDGYAGSRDLMIMGVVRNCAASLEKSVRILQRAMPSCRKLHWIVVESDSSDGTSEVLQRLSEEIPDFAFRSEGALSERIPLRTARLAHCRNLCLDLLAGHSDRDLIDCVVVADLDGVNDLLTPEAFATCWLRADWDVCSANQAGPYYDLWALRHPVWCPSDCWAESEFLMKYGRKPKPALMAMVYSRMIEIQKEGDWVEVDSAFGGLAVYRTRWLLSGRYEGLNSDGAEHCEHVHLHRQIREKGGRIFINPALINTDVTEHSAGWTSTLPLGSLVGSFRFRLFLRLFFGKRDRRAIRNVLKLIDSGR